MIARAAPPSSNPTTAIVVFIAPTARSLVRQSNKAIAAHPKRLFDMAITDLKLEDEGSIPKPGPIGRLARLALGAACLYYVSGIWTFRADLFTDTGSIKPLIWNGLVPGLFLVSYIINIGFSRAWKKWPAIASALLLGSIAAFGYLTTGSPETPLLANTLFWWELYLSLHLGFAFVLASLIATPGCEMRAFHHVYTVITGKPTKEHQCPVGPLAPIDRWEARLDR